HIYVNGRAYPVDFVGTIPSVLPPDQPTLRLGFANGQTFATYPLNGKMDEVRLYTVARSATDIANDAGGTVPTNNNPVPTLASLSPLSAQAGSGSLTLTLTGTNFVGSSVATWSNAHLATTVVSSTQLTAVLPAMDLATAGAFAVSVVNQAPGGGTSTSLPFF